MGPKFIKLSRVSTPLTLVEAYLSEMAIDDAEEIERTHSAVLLAAQYLHEEVGEGEWEAFEAQAFFKKVDHIPRHDQELMGLALMSFFGWMFFRELIEAQPCLKVARELQKAFPESLFLRDLFFKTQKSLSEFIPDIN